jgi:thiol-disulfide isomerase/thioredoxin
MKLKNPFLLFTILVVPLLASNKLSDIEKFASEHEWMKTKSEKYEPNKEILEKLQLNKNEKWIVIAGAWCEDTKHLLPDFYKIALEKKWDLKAIEFIEVDENKEHKDNLHKTYKVENIPVFILYRKNKEVGRITETAPAPLEYLMLEVQNKNTK